MTSYRRMLSSPLELNYTPSLEQRHQRLSRRHCLVQSVPMCLSVFAISGRLIVCRACLCLGLLLLVPVIMAC